MPSMNQPKKDRALLPFAKQNRKAPTAAEHKLWLMLRAKRIGLKFKRQQQIENYIVDFVCFEKGLIIECDGGQHNEEVDKERTLFLEKKGYKVLRFWNKDIFQNIAGVWGMIKKELD